MTIDYIQAKANIPICKFECPSDINAVFLETLSDHVYDLTSIPRRVQHIKFGIRFNQPIEKNVLPAGLQSIIFGVCFRQPIEKDVLPAGLQSIRFGDFFNQPIEKDVLSLFYCSKATIK